MAAFAAVAAFAVITGEVAPGCAGCVAGFASDAVAVVPERVALACCDCARIAGACEFSVAAASAAGVFATSGDIAMFTICGNPLTLVLAGVAVTATMLVMATEDARGGEEMRATLAERVSAGELVGRSWVGMGEIAAVGMIFLGKICVGWVGGGGTRLLL